MYTGIHVGVQCQQNPIEGTEFHRTGVTDCLSLPVCLRNTLVT